MAIAHTTQGKVSKNKIKIKAPSENPNKLFCSDKSAEGTFAYMYLEMSITTH